MAGKIAAHILDFVAHEVKKGRLPKALPWQSGVGDVADAVLELIDMGKVRAGSGSATTLSAKTKTRFLNELYRCKEKVVLRPVEFSNSPEVIRRLGVIAINAAIEVDRYGHVNSTHVMGSQLMNGIGGPGDFLRNGALSFIVTLSIAKNGAISAIVPPCGP